MVLSKAYKKVLDRVDSTTRNHSSPLAVQGAAGTCSLSGCDCSDEGVSLS